MTRLRGGLRPEHNDAAAADRTYDRRRLYTVGLVAWLAGATVVRSFIPHGTPRRVITAALCAVAILLVVIARRLRAAEATDD